MTQRSRASLILLLVLAGILLAWSTLPLQLPVTCLFRRITGLPCASCGLTRATCALVHGEIRQAMQFNLAVLPLASLGIAVVMGLLVEIGTNRPCVVPTWKRYRRLLTTAILVILVIAWIGHFGAISV